MKVALIGIIVPMAFCLSSRAVHANVTASVLKDVILLVVHVRVTSALRDQRVLNVLTAMKVSIARSVHVMHAVQCLVANVNHIANAE